jgi:polyphosphate kinase
MAVRLQVDDRVPPDVLALLRAELGLSDDDVHAGAGVVALSGLAELHGAVAGPRRARPSPNRRPAPVTGERVVAAEPGAQVPALARYR